MSFSISSEAAARPSERRRGRWTALALFALAAVPVVLAFLAYFFWSPQKGLNYGELIEPVPLPDVQLRAPGGETFLLSGLRGKWILIQLGSGSCAEDCVKRHFVMRQVRLMQGREMDRIERLWLIMDDVAPDPWILRAYEGVRVGRGAAALLPKFPARGDPQDHIFLVDPLGNLMLRFPGESDPQGIRKDLARLLKVSHVG
jgi:hypothetical protein